MFDAFRAAVSLFPALTPKGARTQRCVISLCCRAVSWRGATQVSSLTDVVASLENRVSVLEPGRIDALRQKAQLAKADLDGLAKSRTSASSSSSASRNKKVGPLTVLFCEIASTTPESHLVSHLGGDVSRGLW